MLLLLHLDQLENIIIGKDNLDDLDKKDLGQCGNFEKVGEFYYDFNS